jgi:hypothetical protein
MASIYFGFKSNPGKTQHVWPQMAAYFSFFKPYIVATALLVLASF